MRLWRKASGLIKDRNSLWLASLSRRTAFRNPEMEAAVIKATSHDEFSIDMKNVDRVYKWLRLSPSHLKSLIWAISLRMEKTKSWVVAIKGLMLMHGVYSSKLPAIQRIGRLPFDLSNFKDGHSNPSKMWGINAFVRAYFTYLDQKSSLLFMNLQERKNLQNLDNFNNKNVVVQGRYSMIQDLVLLQKLQFLLDMLLEIRPLCHTAIVPLVLEAMDCVIIEVFDVYSRICNGIARVLLRIYSAGKVEASMALRIVQKATIQGEELSLYFELCRSIGVKNAAECPRVEQIPDEDIKELEEIINGASEKASQMPQLVHESTKAIMVHETGNQNLEEQSKLRTVITDRWETFDEDLKQNDGSSRAIVKVTLTPINPFTTSLIPTSTINVPGKPQELPDLISFL
ncbi:putative clathrin assembly protein At1g25240 [Nicotiana tomentosiformis]|uniref:putative clathrin assembly protein At1g25240 n=1 Tax=Nicotiana tomentosiformis TaxID=4098 RepID=UPI00051C77D7|nr:putative clathrin assembly protein At1g25240 [Nicotiana tomentosiformis]